MEVIMPAGQDLLLQAGSQGLGAIFGLMMEGHNDRRQLRQQEQLNHQQLRMQQALMNTQMYNQLQMWEKTNYPAQVEQLKKAGLNPALLYGMGGAGGATVGGGIPGGGGAQAPSGGGEMMGMVSNAMQMQLLNAQRKVLETQAEKNQAEADKTKGVDTQLGLSQIELNVLEKVIKDYTGKDLIRRFEIAKPNQAVETKTYQDELEARQGIAGTIYELWTEGKLKEKSLQEVEQLLLQNAKTREETREIYKKIELLEQNIKGASLNNIITELEAKLQTQTGIDRNSPGWLKILGRLFIQLMGE